MTKKNLREDWQRHLRSIFKEAAEIDLDDVDTDTTADDEGAYPTEPVSDELEDTEDRPETVTLTKDLFTQLLKKAAGVEDEVSLDNNDDDELEDLDERREETGEVPGEHGQGPEFSNTSDKKSDYKLDEDEELDVPDNVDTEVDTEVDVETDVDDLNIEALVDKAVELAAAAEGEPLDVDSFELLVGAGVEDDDESLDVSDNEDEIADYSDEEDVEELDEEGRMHKSGHLERKTHPRFGPNSKKNKEKEEK